MTMKLAQAILWGGLSAGTLDFIGACVSNVSRGVTPLRIAQSIASGWLGAAAFRGGYKTAALGLASHFLIAFGAATIFCLVSRKLHKPEHEDAAFGNFFQTKLFVAGRHSRLDRPHTLRRLADLAGSALAGIITERSFP